MIWRCKIWNSQRAEPLLFLPSAAELRTVSLFCLKYPSSTKWSLIKSMRSIHSTEMKWGIFCWEWQLIRLVIPQPTSLPTTFLSWEPTSRRRCGRIWTSACKLISTPRSYFSSSALSIFPTTMKMQSRRLRWLNRASYRLRPRETRTKLNSKPRWNRPASPKTSLLTRRMDAHSPWSSRLRPRPAPSWTWLKPRLRHTHHSNKTWLLPTRSWFSTCSWAWFRAVPAET